MNLALAFEVSAQKNARKTAVFWGDAEYAYEDIRRQAWCFAGRLQHGFEVKPGDRVGLWLKNRPEFYSAIFGILATGGIVVPINSFLKPSEVSFILGDAGIDVLVTETAFKPAEEPLRVERTGLKLLYVDGIKEGDGRVPGPPDPVELSESSLAVIIYTSGTTGRPKGAMLTHGNLLHNVDSCRQVLGAVEHDRFALLLPMFHSFMLCVCVLLPVLVGGSVVLIKSLHPPKNVLQEIVARQATILPAIPQFFRALIDPSVPVQLPLRLCISGAAPLPGQVLSDFTRKFPIPLLEGYGLSEASPVVSINPVKGPWKSGSIGIPIPGVEMMVQDEAGVELPLGEIGEICARGGNVMLGYWNQPGATAETLRNGWLRTGDVGYRDADGYFYITDRKKDMILVNGINVYPREIEEVVCQFPGIKEAAVIGAPDPRRGEQPVAFVVAQDGSIVNEKSLMRFLRGKLADYKVPRQVIVMQALPRNATGKILKTVLRQMNRR